MRLHSFSSKQLCFLIGLGAFLSMLIIIGFLYFLTGDSIILWGGGLLIVCTLIWLFLLAYLFGKQLSAFTFDLCQTLDNMINGVADPRHISHSETLFSRISHRLSRLYGIMQENRCKLDKERQELQTLISDISHQVKTPISNLKMVTDTLLTKPVTTQEQTEFLHGIRCQTDKLDFLLQALVKTSRLETGAIRLEKKNCCFRRFYREEEVHDEQGIGIGLYLARQIISQQGGYIKVTSEIGKGSTFSVFL